MNIIPSCCNTSSIFPHHKLKIQNYRTLETVCRVAIGTFAILNFPILFVPTLTIGSLIALAQRISYGNDQQATARNRPVCTQGYMEILSGQRYSDNLNLVVTALFIAVHVHCMPTFYVPLCGITLGIWATNQVIDQTGLAFTH